MNSVENVMGYHFKRIGLMLILFCLRLANIARGSCDSRRQYPELVSLAGMFSKGDWQDKGEKLGAWSDLFVGVSLALRLGDPSVEHVQSLDWYNVLHQRKLYWHSGIILVNVFRLGFHSYLISFIRPCF